MPAAPNLSEVINPNDLGHIAASQTVHNIVNNIYKAVVGTTRAANFSLAQTDSGELIPVSSASSVQVTVPSLQVGTAIEVLRLGVGAVTFLASGVTFVIPTGSVATPRVQGSIIGLLWLTTTSVLLNGDLT